MTRQQPERIVADSGSWLHYEAGNHLEGDGVISSGPILVPRRHEPEAACIHRQVSPPQPKQAMAIRMRDAGSF